MKRPNLVIRASAGSGKTFRLTLRFLDLLVAGERPERIFATTFTRKAAGEILGRVLDRLAEALVDAAKRRVLGEQLGQRDLSRERVASTLLDLTRSLHRLRVDTLDSFFVRIATAFSIELNLPSGWTLVDPVRELELRERAVHELLRRDNPEELRTLVTLLSKGEVRRSVGQQILDLVGSLHPLYLDAPNEEAWRIIETPEPLSESELVLAKSGLAALSAPLTKSGRPLSQWKKALDQHLEAALRDDWLGFAKGGIVAKIMVGETEFARRSIPDSVFATFEPLIQHAASMLARTIGNQTVATHQLLARYHEAYATLAQSAGLFTFDGVTRILAGAKALGHLEDVYYRLDADLHHVLLDEFQDTSVPQWRVLEPLAAEAAAQPDDHSFFCVGDEKQAIYGWRGGTPEIFSWLERDLPGIRTEPMDLSYRSAPAVVQTVNDVFGAGGAIRRIFEEDPGVADWLEDFREHGTALRHEVGYTCLRTAPRATDGQAVGTLVHAAEFVQELLHRDPEQSIGVLLRRNQAVSRLIYELRSRGIAASDEGGNPLTDSPAVSVLLSLVRLADHPGDSVAAHHVATSPLATLLSEYRRHDRDAPDLDDFPLHRSPALRRMARRVRRNFVDQGAAPTLAPFAKVLAAVSNQRDRRRLDQLIGLAGRFSPPGPLRPRDFLRLVELQKVDDPEEVPVRVMNVHQAKGLEFDRVVLPELDQRIPGQTPPVLVRRDPRTAEVTEVSRFANKAVRGLVDHVTGEEPDGGFQPFYAEYRARELRESMSVLYVALTRARRELHMIIAPPNPNETKLPASFAGILRAALTDGAPPDEDEVLYEHGPPSAPRLVDLTPPPVAASSTRDLRPIVLSPDRRVRLRSHPSEHDGEERRADLLLRPRSSDALARGSAVHTALEQVQWCEDVDLRSVPALRDLRGTTELEHWLSRERFQERLRANVGTDDAERCVVEVFNEHPFAYGDAESIHTGAIDRWVLASIDGRAVYGEIVDYKTDRISDEADFEAATRRHAPQLAAYRAAVVDLYGVPVISSCLLFLSVDRVHLGGGPAANLVTDAGPTSHSSPSAGGAPSAGDANAESEREPRTERPSKAGNPGDASPRADHADSDSEPPQQLDLFG